MKKLFTKITIVIIISMILLYVGSFYASVISQYDRVNTVREMDLIFHATLLHLGKVG